MFPASRFQRAHATPEQLADVQAEYDSLSPAAQQGFEQRLAGMADADIATEYLNDTPPREVVEPEPVVELEPAVEESEPEPASQEEPEPPAKGK